METRTTFFRLSAALLLAILTTACSKSYVSGNQEFMMVSEADEIEMGREYDPIIVA
jgi:hypothetical protein